MTFECLLRVGNSLPEGLAGAAQECKLGPSWAITAQIGVLALECHDKWREIGTNISW